MDEKKKVSVVMCTYNGEKYIREQSDSIFFSLRIFSFLSENANYK